MSSIKYLSEKRDAAQKELASCNVELEDFIKNEIKNTEDVALLQKLSKEVMSLQNRFHSFNSEIAAKIDRKVNGVNVRVHDRVVKNIAEQVGLEYSEVTLDKSFVEDLGCDSLDLIEIVMVLEDEFEIEIDDDEAEKCSKVNDAYMLVVEKLKANGVSFT